MPKYPADKIKTLPESVQDNFYSGDISEKYLDEIFPLLTEAEVAPVKDLVMDVYYKAVAPAAFPAALVAIVKDPAKAKEAAARILGYDFLPIADYLGADILALIAKEGGDPLLFRSKVPVRDVVERVIGKAELALGEERLEHRLDNVLRSYVVGARKEEQVLEMLKGNAKTSGLGLEEDKALTVLALVKTEKESLEKRGVDIVPDQVYDAAVGSSDDADAEEPVEEEAFIDEEPPSGPLPQEEISAIVASLPQDDVHELAEAVRITGASPQSAAAPKPSLAADAFSAEDAEEIVILQKRLPEKADVKVVGQTTTLEDGLAHEIIATADVHLPNEDIEKRFLYAVKLYIRDIRDALETKSKLTMPVAGGGIGMTEAEAVRVMALLGTRLTDLRAIMAGRAQKAKEVHVSAGVDRQVKGSSDAEKAEQELRDSLYKTLTGKTPHEAAAKEQGVAVLSERKPVAKQAITVIPVVGKDEPHVPDLSKLSVPVVHEVGSHVVAVPAAQAPTGEVSLRGAVPGAAASAGFSEATPSTGTRPTPSAPATRVVLPPPSSPVGIASGSSTPRNDITSIAPASQPPKRVAPPPDALPVVDDDDDDFVVVHEVGDSIDLNIKERAGSIPTSPAPRPTVSTAGISPPKTVPPPIAPPKPAPAPILPPPVQPVVARPKAEATPSMPVTRVVLPPPGSPVGIASGSSTTPRNDILSIAPTPPPVKVPLPMMPPPPAPPLRSAPAAPPSPALPLSSSPAPRPAPMSASAVTQIPTSVAKQTVSDVTFTPKLVGPTDALRSMTIQDFRRLSKDPKEATLKIKDKIDLLADESFERRTEGVKAWQACESNRTYLSMLRASLEGEPLVQVIAKLQNAAQPVLTKEEFDAIMELNRDLRFG